MGRRTIAQIEREARADAVVALVACRLIMATGTTERLAAAVRVAPEELLLAARRHDARKRARPPVIPPGHKYCSLGDHVVPLDDFPPYPRNRDGRYSWCRACKRRREAQVRSGLAQKRRPGTGRVRLVTVATG